MDQESLDFYLKRHQFQLLPRAKDDAPYYFKSAISRVRWEKISKPGTMKDKKTGQEVPVRSVTLVVPPMCDTTVLRTVYNEVMTKRFGQNFRTELVKSVTLPDGSTVTASAITGGIRPQKEQFDKKREGFTEQGVFFEPWSLRNVPIVDGAKNPLPPEAIYAGCWVVALCKAYARPAKGTENPGISFQLEGLQKIADDERFTSGMDVRGTFDDVIPHGSAATSQGPAKAPALEPTGW